MANQFLLLPEVTNTAGDLVRPMLILREGGDDFSVLIQGDIGEWEFDIAALVQAMLSGCDLDLGVEGADARSMTIAVSEVLKLTKFIFEGWRHHGMLFTVRVEWDFLLPRPPVSPTGNAAANVVQ